MPHALRIGCVPYLNAKPLIEWFHSDDCDVVAEVGYAVPSQLARQLDAGRLDAALLSTFHLFERPELAVIHDVSIGADGPVKSVRLFSRVPYPDIHSVALDTSSLTSVALTRILLAEQYGLEPAYVSHAPDLAAMLEACDAGLIIGDLKLFTSPARHVLDLGEAWKALTGLPFAYALWLARRDAPLPQLTDALGRARAWGEARLDALADKWAACMNLPLDRVQDYFFHVMQYDLDARKQQAVEEFRARSEAHGLVKRSGGVAE